MNTSTTMAIGTNNEEDNQLAQKIARIFDETRSSNATHIRKLKDLSALRSSLSSSSPARFLSAFSKTLTPLFNFPRRVASSERIVRFVAAFAVTPDSKNASVSDSFLEDFLRFLLGAAAAANKTARFRACQIISEVINMDSVQLIYVLSPRNMIKVRILNAQDHLQPLFIFSPFKIE